ncbi:MAG: cardiolipin synthase [Akkermansia sp.]
MFFLNHSILILSLVFYAFGIVLAFLALLHTRTPQGTFAWVISLIVFPYVAVPLYLIFGPRRFEGYIEARRNRMEKNSKLSQLTETLLSKTNEMRVSATDKHTHLFGSLSKLVDLSPSMGNDCQLLIDGEQAYPAMYEAILNAKEYILVEFYIIKSDSVGNWLRDLLVKKAQKGVRVYVVYDEIGSHKLPVGYISTLREAGVQMQPFNGKRFFLRNIVRVNFRNHRKVVVVDGKVCFVGGMNVGKDYIGAGAMGYWRDTVLKIEGPAVLQTQLSFLEDWHWATKGGILTLIWDIDVQEANRQMMILPSGPADPTATWRAAFIALANAAEKKMWIASPYFVPDEAVLASLQAAALRGVDVRILTPDKADHIMVKLSSFTFIPDTLPYGIKLMRYTKGFLHQKVILVDDDIVSVGTANLDNRSLTLNFEITAIIHDREIAGQACKMLEEDLTHSIPMQLSDYKGKSLLFRIACSVARLMAPIQ